MPEKDRRNEVFSKIFGFKVGDRVKWKRGRWHWNWHGGHKLETWRYGTVMIERERAIRGELGWIPKEPLYYVRPDGEDFNIGLFAEDMVRVRKYERKKR